MDSKSSEDEQISDLAQAFSKKWHADQSDVKKDKYNLSRRPDLQAVPDLFRRSAPYLSPWHSSYSLEDLDTARPLQWPSITPLIMTQSQDDVRSGLDIGRLRSSTYFEFNQAEVQSTGSDVIKRPLYCQMSRSSSVPDLVSRNYLDLESQKSDSLTKQKENILEPERYRSLSEKPKVRAPSKRSRSPPNASKKHFDYQHTLCHQPATRNRMFRGPLPNQPSRRPPFHQQTLSRSVLRFHGSRSSFNSRRGDGSPQIRMSKNPRMSSVANSAPCTNMQSAGWPEIHQPNWRPEYYPGADYFQSRWHSIYGNRNFCPNKGPVFPPAFYQGNHTNSLRFPLNSGYWDQTVYGRKNPGDGDGVTYPGQNFPLPYDLNGSGQFFQNERFRVGEDPTDYTGSSSASDNYYRRGNIKPFKLTQELGGYNPMYPAASLIPDTAQNAFSESGIGYYTRSSGVVGCGSIESNKMIPAPTLPSMLSQKQMQDRDLSGFANVISAEAGSGKEAEGLSTPQFSYYSDSYLKPSNKSIDAPFRYTGSSQQASSEQVFQHQPLPIGDRPMYYMDHLPNPETDYPGYFMEPLVHGRSSVTEDDSNLKYYSRDVVDCSNQYSGMGAYGNMHANKISTPVLPPPKPIQNQMQQAALGGYSSGDANRISTKNKRAANKEGAHFEQSLNSRVAYSNSSYFGHTADTQPAQVNVCDSVPQSSQNDNSWSNQGKREGLSNRKLWEVTDSELEALRFLNINGDVRQYIPPELDEADKDVVEGLLTEVMTYYQTQRD